MELIEPMHIVRSSAPIQLPYGQVLPPGEWLMQDDTAFGCAVRAERGTVELKHWQRDIHLDRIVESYEGAENIKSILLIRSGAIGDLLLLTPAIKALRAKYPGAMIWLSCYKKHWDIFAHGDTHFVEYPLPVSSLSEFDLIIPLENVIELATEKGVHATDAFAEVLGVTVTDYRPVYRVTDEEVIAYTRSKFARVGNGHRVGIQIHASSRIRGYPMQQWNAVLVQLIARGWEIMLLGDKDGIKGAPPAVKDCSALTFREAAAVLATCDVFCGVDSAFFNLCPALGVPAIGLFGPVDWATRIKDGSNQLALTTHAECAPCGWTNSRGGRQWPEGMPCEKAGTCVPLANIDPSRIVAKIDAYRK